MTETTNELVLELQHQSIGFDPKKLLAANEGRSALLAKCILAGLVEPEKSVDPIIQILVAQEMIRQIKRTRRVDGAARALTRSLRALEWALRDNVSVEVAVVLLAGIQPVVPSLKKTEEYASFAERFASVLGD